MERADFFRDNNKEKYALYSLTDAIIRLTLYWKYKKDYDSEGIFDKYRKSLLIRCKDTCFYLSEFKYSTVLFLFRYNFPLLRILISFTFGREAS